MEYFRIMVVRWISSRMIVIMQSCVLSHVLNEVSIVAAFTTETKIITIIINRVARLKAEVVC